MQQSWTTQKIKDKILESKELLSIDRMPTRSELFMLYGESSLYNKIAKTGGFTYWAKELGLDIKQSDSTFGWIYEDKVYDFICAKNMKCSKTALKHPYDIFVESSVQIDVKASNIYRDGSFVFRLSKNPPSCDFYVLVCVDNNERYYIIPSHFMLKVQINFHEFEWLDFKDRWDLIEKEVRFKKSYFDEFPDFSK